MFRKFNKIVLSLLILILTFNFMHFSAYAEKSSSYGIFVSKWTFFVSSADNVLNFQFLLGSSVYNANFTAKLLDSNEKVIIKWENPVKIPSDKKYSIKTWNLSSSDQKLATNNSYTFRLYCSFVSGGENKIFNWDFPFVYRNDLGSYTSSDYGMDSRFKFISYDYGDISFNVWLSATKKHNVKYKLRLVDPYGNTVYSWKEISINSGSELVKYKFDTNNTPIQDIGTYKIIVTGIVEYSGLQKSFSWTHKYDYN